MEHEKTSSSQSPHVLIFPLPIQGHVTPMLHLAQLFCLANFHVTFLNTTHNHQSLTRFTDIKTRFARFPGFRFKVIPDGLAHDRLMTGDGNLKDRLKDFVHGLASNVGPLLREMLLGSGVTCLVVDGWLSFAYGMANEADVPVIAFRCSSACCNWAYFCIPKLIDAGEVPFKDNHEDMDRLVKNVPGMDGFLRCRDLPSFCRAQDTFSCHDLHLLFSAQSQQTQRAHSLILNTFEDLEGPILSILRVHCSQVYSIGPLHAHLKHRLGLDQSTVPSNSYSSLWEMDQSCILWLDQKPDKSVVYVSFGSLAILTRAQLMELWAGLVQSKKYFLWVVKANLINESGPDCCATPDELLEGTKEKRVHGGLGPTRGSVGPSGHWWVLDP